MKLLLSLCEGVAVCLPPFLLFSGVLLLIYLRGFPLAHPVRLARSLGAAGRTSLGALLLSLAGTLGVGNIAGVGAALAIGGEGAVLWMLVGGLAATVLKYAEVALALDARRAGAPSRGALDYIVPRLGRGAGLAFAALTLTLALTMGSLLQGGVIAEALGQAVGVRPLSTGLVLTAITLLLFLGGRRAITRLTGVLSPPLTLLYWAAAVYVIVCNAEALPHVCERILRGAFCPEGVVGGAAGLGMARALRAGIGKGLFSNEAGAGTAPFAHGGADTAPAVQGALGVLEVAIDTLFLCALTALAVLSALDPLPPLTGTALVAAAFESVLGRSAGLLLSLSVILFSYATVACWAHYGQIALAELSPPRGAGAAYALLFSLALTVGAILGAGDGFVLCDGVLAAMCFINLTALLRSLQRIREITAEGGMIRKKKREQC